MKHEFKLIADDSSFHLFLLSISSFLASFLSFPFLSLPGLALPFLSFPSPTPGAKKKALGAAPRGTWLFAVFVHAERAQRTTGGETIHGTGRFTQSQTLHVYIGVVWGVNSSAYTP